VKNIGAIANPEVLEEIAAIAVETQPALTNAL
ncbi:acetoacetate-CoA ligase, partial [Vibrio parahaemolyticus IDH02640]